MIKIIDEKKLTLFFNKLNNTDFFKKEENSSWLWKKYNEILIAYPNTNINKEDLIKIIKDSNEKNINIEKEFNVLSQLDFFNSFIQKTPSLIIKLNYIINLFLAFFLSSLIFYTKGILFFVFISLLIFVGFKIYNLYSTKMLVKFLSFFEKNDVVRYKKEIEKIVLTNNFVNLEKEMNIIDNENIKSKIIFLIKNLQKIKDISLKQEIIEDISKIKNQYLLLNSINEKQDFYKLISKVLDNYIEYLYIEEEKEITNNKIYWLSKVN